MRPSPLTSIDRHAQELRGLVNAFMTQFSGTNAAAVNGPHVGLNCQELRVVERLGDGGPAKMRELAEHLKLAANSVTTLVDHLEQRGVVRRNRSDEDRRVVMVELTDHGRTMYDAAVNEMLAALRCMLEALEPGEQEAFVGMFRKIARAPVGNAVGV
jgi:DNA-binding MarR family transcriptional regulator